MSSKLTLEYFEKMSSGDYEPHTTEKWLVREFPKFGSETLDSIVGEAMDLPFPMLQDKGKSVASSQVFFPSGIQIQGFSIQLGVDQKLRAIRYIQAWQNAIRNPTTGGYYPAASYKRTLLVDLFDVKGNVIGTAKLENVWPLGVSQLQLGATSERSIVPVQFMCDQQLFEFN